MNAVARLSPSKINAFRDCPQHFAFRYVDRLEEPQDPYLFRGSLVHAVCERHFDLPPAQRTPANAVELLYRLWELYADSDDELGALFSDAEAVTAWLLSSERLLATWFRLEAPGAIPEAQREVFVKTEGEDLVLAGFIDRLDQLPDGTWRITDYKTGPAPGPLWERGAFFQLRFYAMVAAQSLGITVSKLRLVHLAGDGEILEMDFDDDGVAAVSKQVDGLAEAMRRSFEAEQWRTNVGRRCDWCSFKQRCPAWAEQPADAEPQLTTTG